MHVTKEEPIRKVWDRFRVVEERKGEGVWVGGIARGMAQEGNMLKYNSTMD